MSCQDPAVEYFTTISLLRVSGRHTYKEDFTMTSLLRVSGRRTYAELIVFCHEGMETYPFLHLIWQATAFDNIDAVALQGTRYVL